MCEASASARQVLLRRDASERYVLRQDKLLVVTIRGGRRELNEAGPVALERLKSFSSHVCHKSLYKHIVVATRLLSCQRPEAT